MTQQSFAFDERQRFQCLTCQNWSDQNYCPICNPPLIQPKRVGMTEYSSADLARLNTSKSKVLELAKTGVWFTNKQLIELTGSVDAPKRRRELEHVDHYKFEKRKIGKTNVFEFRLVPVIVTYPSDSRPREE